MARRTLNDDLFFFHRDRKAVEWLYHNPDSDSYGQFVKVFIPYDELLHTFSVDLSIKAPQEFFVYSLSSDNKGYLIDKGTPEYEAEMKRFFCSKPDAVGATRKTISKIILEAAQAKADEFKKYINPTTTGVSRYAVGIEGHYPNIHDGDETKFYRDILLPMNGDDFFVLNSSIKDDRIKPFNGKSLWFENTIFENVDFQRVDFIGTEFHKCTFKNCTFRGCNLYAAKFLSCHIVSLDQNNCILSYAQFEGKTNARNITIKNSEISGMKISTQPRETPRLKGCYQSSLVKGLNFSHVSDLQNKELTER